MAGYRVVSSGWSMAQACGDCGTDNAFTRAKDGAAICRECGHEHDMDRTQLGDGERFEWVWDTLYVTFEQPVTS